MRREAAGGVSPGLLYGRLWLGLAGGVAWLAGVGAESAALRGAGLAALVIALALRFLPRLRREAEEPPAPSADRPGPPR